MVGSLIQRKATSVLSCFLLGICVLPVSADSTKKVLQVTKETPIKDVQQSQIGYRDTLIFYTFRNERTVLRLQIDNKDKSFPMKGALFFFSENIKEEGINKWINNQHSDGLFIDAPQPTGTRELPAETCKVTRHKYLDRGRMGLGNYDNYGVSYQVKDFDDKKGLKIKGFKGETKVHVAVKDN